MDKNNYFSEAIIWTFSCSVITLPLSMSVKQGVLVLHPGFQMVTFYHKFFQAFSGLYAFLMTIFILYVTLLFWGVVSGVKEKSLIFCSVVPNSAHDHCFQEFFICAISLDYSFIKIEGNLWYFCIYGMDGLSFLGQFTYHILHITYCIQEVP